MLLDKILSENEKWKRHIYLKAEGTKQAFLWKRSILLIKTLKKRFDIELKSLELEGILENIYVKLFLLIFVPIMSGRKLKP